MKNAAGCVGVLGLLAIIFVGLLARSELGRLLLGRWSFTKSVDVRTPGSDRSTYYRLKVNLTYRGEPLDFDIVVGCRVKVTTYKDDDRTVEVGIAPMIFGLKTTNGHGVVVRPPQACNGETTDNGGIPQTLLPLIATYDSVAEPWFGVAYASEDAYDSPRSELKFLGATISKATLEEWQAWRQTEAPENFVTYALLGINSKNMWDFPKWKPGYRLMATDCLGASWVKLPDQVREIVRPFWPSDKPVYWYPNWRLRDALWDALGLPKTPRVFDGNSWFDYLEPATAQYGLARRQAGSTIAYKSRVAGDVFPALLTPSINQLGPNGEFPSDVKSDRRRSWVGVEFKPELRGFAYCDESIFKVEGVPGGTPSNPEMLLSKINNMAINDRLEGAITESELLFERDEYVILPRRYAIGTIFGGL